MWIRLARASNNAFKQYNSYKTAIDLLKKDHEFELVEIYIELSEWLLRNHYSNDLIQENLLLAADILIEIELEDDGFIIFIQVRMKNKMEDKVFSAEALVVKNHHLNKVIEFLKMYPRKLTRQKLNLIKKHKKLSKNLSLPLVKKIKTLKL